jgi:hypothetical protein
MIVLGEFSGRLSKEGETLVLLGSLGETIQSIAYLPTWRRPGSAKGSSLVPVSERQDIDAWSGETGWRGSASVSGSPGRIDVASLPPPAAPVIRWDGSWVEMTLPMDAGVSAELQGRASPETGAWLPVARYGAGNARTETIRIPPADAARFFRWVVVE